jgi:hypothetical protein
MIALVGFPVPKSNHVIDADIWGDRNIAREIEIDRNRDKFKKRHEVVRRNQWHMQDKHENVLLRMVDVWCFNEKGIQRFIDEGEHLGFFSHFIDVVHNFEEHFMV